MIGRQSPMDTALRCGDVVEVINVLSLPLCPERHRGVVINSNKPAVIEYSPGSNWGSARVLSVSMSAIAVATVKPDNLARVGIYGSIDLDPILRELIMAVKASKEVRTRCSIVLKPCTAKTRAARSNACRI